MNIYEQFSDTFPGISAFVLMVGEDKVGKLAFKTQQAGAAGIEVTCFFHLHGLTMTRAVAVGGGFPVDREAFDTAVARAQPAQAQDDLANMYLKRLQKECAAATHSGVNYWTLLARAGITAFSAI